MELFPMNFKLKPLSLAALATATVLSGCSTEEETIEKTRVFDPESNTGLWCKLPDVVKTVDADFHPLTEAEISALETVALEITDPNGEMTEEEVTAFKASFNPYTFDYDTYDLYGPLGLTMEEMARQAVAKEEARQFKIGQKQQEIFGDDFDTWFDAWFATVPYTDYLGKSQRLPKATLGMELSLSAANNGEEACYTPPTECPNYQVVDESGSYNCVIPEENPLADEAPAIPADALEASGAGNAVLFFRKNGTQDEENYKDITIHSWNNSNCTAYNEETSTTNWGSGKAAAGIDENHGIYWILDLQEQHDSCGNIIVYNKTSGDKFITQNDAMMPLGNSGDVVFHNLDKISFFQEGFPANLLDGAYLANQHPYFGAAAGSKSCGWGTTLDDAGEACIGQAIDNCPAGTYAVGVGQVDIPSKCIAEFDTDATTLYLRGGFNGWGNPVEGNDFEYVGEGVYRKIFAYGEHAEDATAGEDGTVSYFFKVADADWSEPSTYGGIKGGSLPSVGGGAVAVTAGEGVGQDMSVSMAENSNYQFVFNASDVSAATLEIQEVPVQAFPNISIDGELSQMTYKGDGIYNLVKQEMAAGTFTIGFVDQANGFVYGAGETNTVGINEEIALVADGGGISLTIEDAQKYDFIMDFSDVDAPTFKVNPSKPLGANVTYIRGSVNGWGTPSTDEIMYDEATKTYSIIYGLEASEQEHQFKFATEDWAAVNMGFNEVIASDDEDALPLVNKDGNIGVVADESMSYKFELIYGEETPTLKVSKLPIYIRGGMNGWGEVDQMALNTVDEVETREAGHEYISTLSLGADSVFFKVATGDWSTVNLGSATDGPEAVSLDTPLVLGSANDNNLSFDPDAAGDFKFIFNQKTKTLTISE
jgi:pullulanase